MRRLVTAAKARCTLDRLRGLLRPPLTVLRVNVFRPPGEVPHPVILCAHPYGKDDLPAPKRGGGFKVPFQ